MIWIIVFAVGGVAVLAQLAKPHLSPTGKRWPSGVSTQNETQAVTIALAKETDPAKLRDFARALEPYDKSSAQRLYQHALALQVSTTHSASASDPAFSQLAALKKIP